MALKGLETQHNSTFGEPSAQSELRVDTFDNLVSVQRPGFGSVGFHIRNLEVAQLSDEAVAAVRSQVWSETNPAAAELESWNQSLNPEVRSGKILFGPRTITINVTQICNLHCTYCAAGGDGTFGDPVKKISIEKTLPQLRSLMESVPEGKSFHITFLGGEPLLYPDGVSMLVEYVRARAIEKNFKADFTIVTNGTQFSEENIQMLCELKANIYVSIDGAPNVNDRTRPNKAGKGVTAQVVEGLKNLLQRKSELGKVELSGVFGKSNLDLAQAYEFYRTFSVDSFDFTYDHLETSEEVNEAYIQGLTAVADRAFSEGGEAELRRIKYFDRIFELLDNQQQVENFCGAGKSLFMIDARNNLYTCPWVAGDKKEIVGHGGQIWAEAVKNYQAPLVEQNGCGSCWARTLCGGGCMFIHKNKTGSKHKVDENFCKRTKDLIATTLLYYQRSRETL